jgi:hypothetical protein
MIAEEELLSSRLRDDLRDNSLSTSDMSDKTKPELRLEIAHVLFIDIVGYSKLLIDDQTELLVIDAGLGRKEDALREGRRAVELLPVEKDSINGPVVLDVLAMIYAWVGEKDLAIDQLTRAIQHPGSSPYGVLRLFPHWDPLRGDPRFEKIVESLAPKK